ncbi:thioesterase superfamily protein [Roseibium sp. TrichSKD4]|nr:thioesterase superfamily protein [Roseibium sp. TrichSKD4]
MRFGFRVRFFETAYRAASRFNSRISSAGSLLAIARWAHDAKARKREM